MIRNIIYSILFVFLTVSVSSCVQSSLKDGEYKIEIYATNDVHGRFFDSLYVSGSNEFVHNHSMASVASVIKERRKNLGEEKIVFLDIGDHLQGDNAAYYFNFIDTVSVHIFSKIANYLKYDAVVVGNHDIEAGHPVYDKIVGELDMPYLAANAIDLSSGEPYFEPYTIIERQGLRVAVIGMTNPNIPNWLSNHLWEEMKFQEIIDSLSYWVDYVNQKESPHIIIAALHSGLGETDSYSLENSARFVAKNIKGIDVVFASHDHKLVKEKIMNGEKEVLLLEGGSRASHLSVANLDIVVKDEKVISLSANGYHVDIDGIIPDSDYVKEFSKEFCAVREFTNRKAGILQDDITTKDAYFGSSAFIDMIHTLQLDVSGADISFVAPLSFNVSKNAGELIYHDLMEIYPYENQLYVISMTGEEIKNYLEFSYAKWVNTYPSESGHMLQISVGGNNERARFNNIFFNFDSAAGIIYEVDITKEAGDKINIISMADSSAFHKDHKYNVALSSYRASGGGNLLLDGAGIPKEEIELRWISKYSDIRKLLFEKFEEEGLVEAYKLNHWKFIPEELVKELSAQDYEVLFRN